MIIQNPQIERKINSECSQQEVRSPESDHRNLNPMKLAPKKRSEDICTYLVQALLVCGRLINSLLFFRDVVSSPRCLLLSHFDFPPLEK